MRGWVRGAALLILEGWKDYRGPAHPQAQFLAEIILSLGSSLRVTGEKSSVLQRRFRLTS